MKQDVFPAKSAKTGVKRVLHHKYKQLELITVELSVRTRRGARMGFAEHGPGKPPGVKAVVPSKGSFWFTSTTDSTRFYIDFIKSLKVFI